MNSLETSSLLNLKGSTNACFGYSACFELYAAGIMAAMCHTACYASITQTKDAQGILLESIGLETVYLPNVKERYRLS